MIQAMSQLIGTLCAAGAVGFIVLALAFFLIRTVVWPERGLDE